MTRGSFCGVALALVLGGPAAGFAQPGDAGDANLETGWSFDCGFELRGGYRDSDLNRFESPFPFDPSMLPLGETKGFLETVDAGSHAEVSVIRLALDAAYGRWFGAGLRVDVIDLYDRNPTSEDRKVDGFFETMTVDQNIYLGFLSSPRVKRFLYSAREMKRVADQWIASLSISALKRTLKIVEYSGGNQQKVVVGKSLAQEPSVVIFDEPTRGVDVSAIPQIHDAIRGLAGENKAVIVISSYLPEILAISDRILVARGGRIVEEMARADATEDKIMYAAIH